ncbi:hypothetical protein RB653_000681 [Dictyostelium firmibasis]|uniref:Uncharacterized protein n=1 Tax=Dictyostelium firmibasis TaxID=79012 RepID=A0AAN7U331_9MYCE
MGDRDIPDEWDTVSEDQIKNNLLTLEISNKLRELKLLEVEYEKLEEKEKEIENKKTTTITTTDIKIKEFIKNEIKKGGEEIVYNEGGEENGEEEEEEPLLLINFTKWSYNKIKYMGGGKIENQDLFDRLVNKLNSEEEFFITMTDDLLERELAFHTTNKQWREDIKQLERQYQGDYFSLLSYPPTLGGFLLENIWSKIKEGTEWKSVNILKCIYLAKTNRSLLYKHNMALAIEFMALEQKLLGPTAKRLKDEEDLEYNIQLRQYEELMQKRYENEINEGIIKNLQQVVYTNEGISNNLDRINSSKINEINDDYNNNEDSGEYSDGDGSYCSTCDGRDSDSDYDDGNDENNGGDDRMIEEPEEDDTTTSTSFQQSDDDEADNELDDEDNRKKKKEKLIEERKIKEIEAERIHKENEKKKIETPPPPTLNILDKIIAMIFSKLTVQSNKESHYQTLKRLESSIKETWIEEFGCLPPNCLWREEQ